MLVGSGFGDIPGMQTPVETFEQAFMWGHPYQMKYANGYFSASAADPTNSPTWELRRGLILGIQTATGQWLNYSPTATDGSQVAAGILTESLRMQDVLTGVNTTKFWAVCVGGNLRAAGLIGLDNYARSCLRQFQFDDDPNGNSWFPWQAFVTKTANYQIVASDNFTLFDNTGAAGAVTLTLPAIANGYYFGMSVIADQNFAMTSFEGANIVGFNNAAASTISYQTVGARIGGQLRIFSNPGATKWIVATDNAGANTVTTA